MGGVPRGEIGPSPRELIGEGNPLGKLGSRREYGRWRRKILLWGRRFSLSGPDQEEK